MSIPTPPANDPAAKRKRINKLILLVVGSAFGVLVLLIILGLIIQALGLDTKDPEAVAPQPTGMSAAPTSPPSAAATSSAPPIAAPSATNSPEITAPAETTTASVAPARNPSDSRCTPAARSLVDSVTSGLSKSGHELRNGTVITIGDVTYFGASIFDSAGKMAERSDVWVIKDGKVFASTGGARNNTTFPKASSAPLNISPGDEAVQAVDNCVVNITTGRR